MPFKYDIPPNSGPLRQGELLGDIWEHRPPHPPVEMPQGSTVEVTSIHHPFMIVMTADCDLEQDFNARFSEKNAAEQAAETTAEQKHPALVPHVLLCEVYDSNQIRPRVPGSDVWKRIQQNQDERYHHFPPAQIGDRPVDEFLDLYLDFKKTLALPTENLYLALAQGVSRLALVPSPYIHDLMHRFYGFLSRVGLPD